VHFNSARSLGASGSEKRTGGSLNGVARRLRLTNGLEPFNRISLPGSITWCVRGCAAVQEIAGWLDKLGMSEYAQRFAENRIDFSVLSDLTDQDLEKMGVVLGDRRKILRAITGLVDGEKAAAQRTAASAEATPRTAATPAASCPSRTEPTSRNLRFSVTTWLRFSNLLELRHFEQTPSVSLVVQVKDNLVVAKRYLIAIRVSWHI